MIYAVHVTGWISDSVHHICVWVGFSINTPKYNFEVYWSFVLPVVIEVTKQNLWEQENGYHQYIEARRVHDIEQNFVYRLVAYHISSEYWALPKIRFDHYLLSFFSSVFWWQVAFPIIKNILCQQHYQITVPALFWSRNCYITLPNRNLGYYKVAWKWWTRFLGIQSACRH